MRQEEINRQKKLNSTYKIDGNNIYFGSYPQTIKNKKVKIKSRVVNSNYYLGSDGEKYVKATANPFRDDYTFTNGEKVIKDNEYYFKVEPVKWKILSQDNGEYFIFSDCILNAYRFDLLLSNYDESEIKRYLNEEMFNEMFSNEQKNIIQNTNFGKLFLLSKEELTNKSYNFNSNELTFDTERRKQVTDYAIANYTWYNADKEYFKNGWYWLRTPYRYLLVISYAYCVNSYGRINYFDVAYSSSGLVPALRITIK